MEWRRRKEWNVGGGSGVRSTDSLVKIGKWSDGEQWVTDRDGASEESVMMTRTVCFKKKLLFVMQNLGLWDRGSKDVVESAIFGIADPDLPIHYATFMGLQWWLRVVYSWVPPLLSIFGQKKPKSRFGKNLTLLGINRGLKLNLSFITPKRHVLAWFHVFWAIACKNPSIDLTCTRVWEKRYK